MFILVLFGYKQSKIFTLECLTATLMDCIWAQCTKEITKILIIKEEFHVKEMFSLGNRIKFNDKNITELDLKLQIQDDQAGQELKKDDKKAPKQAVPKKGGKEAVITNPDEQKRLDLQKENEKNKESIIKYEEKLSKLRDLKEKYKILQENLQNGQLVLELCDKTGERKFVKTKLSSDASSFLADKNSYILGYLVAGLTADDEEQVEALQIDGFIVRSVAEDVGAIDEPLLQAKKEDKKKAKKK